MIGDNPFQWEVKMFDFGDTPIGNDLKAHADKFNTRNVSRQNITNPVGKRHFGSQIHSIVPCATTSHPFNSSSFRILDRKYHIWWNFL